MLYDTGSAGGWDPWTVDFSADELGGTLSMEWERQAILFTEITGSKEEWIHEIFGPGIKYVREDASPFPEEATIFFQKSAKDPAIGFPVVFNSGLFRQPTDEYHADIAKLAILLAANAYDLDNEPRGEAIIRAYHALGISNERIMLFNYAGGRLNTAGSQEINHMQFSIASRNMGEEDLLLITLRGSGELGDSADWISDAMAESVCSMNTWVHLGFYQFMRNVLDGIDVYLDRHPEIRGSMEADRLKVLVCGHSYGAAATNLLGAYLTSSSNPHQWAGTEDTYVYAFATPRVVHEKDDLQRTAKGRSFGEDGKAPGRIRMKSNKGDR